MHPRTVKFEEYVHINIQNTQIYQINPLIGKYSNFEFLANPAKELTELFCRNTKFFKRGPMRTRTVKFDEYVHINIQNTQTYQINPFIGNYSDFEFLANPAKELTELFCRNAKFSKKAK